MRKNSIGKPAVLSLSLTIMLFCAACRDAGALENNSTGMAERSVDTNCSETEAMEETAETTQDWSSFYEQEMETLSGYEMPWYQEYYDISGDGVPEMLVSADGQDIDIFTIADGNVQHTTYMGVSMSSNLSENDGCINGPYLYEGMAILECDGSHGTGWSFTVIDDGDNVTTGRYCTFYPEKFWLNGEYVEQETLNVELSASGLEPLYFDVGRVSVSGK